MEMYWKTVLLNRLAQTLYSKLLFSGLPLHPLSAWPTGPFLISNAVCLF